MLTSLLYTRLSAALSSNAPTNAPTNSPSDTCADTAFASSLLAGYSRYTSARFLDRPAVLAQLTSEDIFITLKSAFLNDFCK
jgi:hypothetical protein